MLRFLAHTKRSLFGNSNNQIGSVKKAMAFEDQNSANSPLNNNPTISFSQMIQPKSSMMFQSIRTARMNFENPLSPQNNQSGETNATHQTPETGMSKPFKRIDSLTPEFKK